MKKLSYYTSHNILNRTDEQRQLPQAINNVFQAYTCAVKNIENSANFFIRNLISSYVKIKNVDINNNQVQDSLNDKKPEYVYQLKSILHANEQLCIDLANQAIDIMNTKKDELIKSKAQKIAQGIKPRKSVAKKIKLDNKDNPVEKKIHYLKPFEYEIDKTAFYQHIDINLICNVLKLKECLYPQYKDFTLVNSHISQAAVDNVVTSYNNFYKAIKAYYKNRGSFTGKPQIPSYHSKNHRCSFSLNKDRFKAKDNISARVITKDNIEEFTSIRDKANTNQLFLDTAKKLPVNNKNIEFYNSYNLMPFVEEKINKIYENEKALLDKLENIYNRHSNKKDKKNKFTAELDIEFVELKVIPLVRPNKIGSTVELVIVVKHNLNLPENSMLNKLLTYNPKFLDLSEKDKITCTQNYTKKILRNDDEVLSIENKEISLNIVSKNINELFRIGSIDLGVKYPCTITFNDGSEAVIISGKEYYKTINNIDVKIDKHKEKLNNSTIKAIQSQFDKDKNSYNENKTKIINAVKISKEYIEFTVTNTDKLEQEKILNSLVIESLKLNNIAYPELSKQDKELLEQYNNNCRNDSYLVAQQKYKNNYIHQLSTKIIALCLSKRLDFLTIGKNELWKQNSNIGRKNNRAFHNFPHSKLIELLQYKALKFGIVILVTEESYTSKTSFINNATLKKYDKKDKEVNIVKNKIAKVINSTESIPRDKQLLDNLHRKADKLKENPYGGYRKSREQYINKDNLNNNKEKALKVVHADINASYNIMRKIFIDIKYDRNYHNVNYNLVNIRSNKKAFKCIIKTKLSL